MDLPQANVAFPTPPPLDPGKPLHAWHDNPKLKRDTVERMREHRSRDQIIQGMYLVRTLTGDPEKPYRGCFLGCLVTEEATAALEWPLSKALKARHLFDWYTWAVVLFGIPEEIAWLIEDVFESLPEEAAADFAVEVLDAIPVAADLRPVSHAVGFTPDMSVDPINWEWRDSDEAPEVSADRLLEALRTAPVEEFDSL